MKKIEIFMDTEAIVIIADGKINHYNASFQGWMAESFIKELIDYHVKTRRMGYDSDDKMTYL